MNDYPDNWKGIAARIKTAAENQCERCGNPHEVATGHVLTVHHLDGDTDLQLLKFLQALATATRGEDGPLLPEWESRFLASFLQSSRPSLWFTAGRRKATEAMWRKYETMIGQPMPQAESGKRKAEMPVADEGGCEFLGLDADRKFKRCNAPAAWVNRRGFRYCAACAESVQKRLQRRGAVMELRPFSPKAETLKPETPK